MAVSPCWLEPVLPCKNGGRKTQSSTKRQYFSSPSTWRSSSLWTRVPDTSKESTETPQRRQVSRDGHHVGRNQGPKLSRRNHDAFRELNKGMWKDGGKGMWKDGGTAWSRMTCTTVVSAVKNRPSVRTFQATSRLLDIATTVAKAASRRKI
jgi:hypothetical protein